MNHDSCVGLEGLLPGEGPLTSSVMLVGEAGGADEAEQGRPFVGRSGSRLDVLLGMAGIPRETVFVTNLVQHRPPNNRNPHKAEVTACVPNLLEEIRIVDPDIIITLGAVPLEYFCKGESVTRVHGEPRIVEIEGRERVLIPWLHPAYTLRSTAALEDAYEDAIRYRNDKGANVNRQPARYSLETSGTIAGALRAGGENNGNDNARGRQDTGKFICGGRTAPLHYHAFDLETTAPRRGGKFDVGEAKIVGYSIANRERVAFYVAASPTAVGGLLASPTDPIVCHNTKFEYRVLKNHGFKLVNFHDTKGLAYVCQYNDTSLKGLTRSLLREQPIEYGDLQIDDSTDLEAVRAAFASAYEYGAGDADHTFRLFPMLWAEAEQNNVLHVYTDIELPLIPVIADIEETGVAVDEQKRQEVEAEIAEAKAKAAEQIKRYLPQIDNVGSRLQLSDALSQAGCPLTKKTPSGKQLATDEETLRKVRDWNPAIIDSILEYYKMQKRAGFVTAFGKLCGTDGRLHPNLNQFGHYEELGGRGASPSTGRLSESGPNLQQVPNHEDEYWGPRIRSILHPGDGYIWLSVDFSQQEARLGAYVSGDGTLLAEFNNGVDVYSAIASEVYGVSITKEGHPHERQVGKTFFLAWLFGAGAAKLTEIDPKISRAAAQRGLARLKAKYPLVASYVEDTKKFMLANGYVETAFGRKRWLPEIYSNSRGLAAEALRQGANARIQGTGADIIKLALVKIAAILEPLDAAIMNTVHDSIDIMCRTEDIEAIIKMIEAEVATILPEVVLPLDFSVGQNWGNLVQRT